MTTLVTPGIGVGFDNSSWSRYWNRVKTLVGPGIVAGFKTLVDPVIGASLKL